MTELFLKELGKFEEAAGVGQEVVKATLPTRNAAADSGLALLLFTLEGQAVKALTITATGQLVLLLLRPNRGII